MFDPWFTQNCNYLCSVINISMLVVQLIIHRILIGGYTADHPVIVAFWRVTEGFTDKQKCELLKFVTSCSRPPILGFKASSHDNILQV